jgi:hypothetical protein
MRGKRRCEGRREMKTFIPSIYWHFSTHIQQEKALKLTSALSSPLHVASPD